MLNGDHFRLQASKLGPQDAVKVYTRASLIGDKVLAAAFLHKAAQSPQMRLEVSTLRELPSEALLKLVRNVLSISCEMYLADVHIGADSDLLAYHKRQRN